MEKGSNGLASPSTGFYPHLSLSTLCRAFARKLSLCFISSAIRRGSPSIRRRRGPGFRPPRNERRRRIASSCILSTTARRKNPDGSDHGNLTLFPSDRDTHAPPQLVAPIQDVTP